MALSLVRPSSVEVIDRIVTDKARPISAPIATPTPRNTIDSHQNAKKTGDHFKKVTIFIITKAAKCFGFLNMVMTR